nr:MAG TPA: hypothetical protein [Caudoviricetes sp.]
MIKKIDSFLNWTLVVLLLIAACIGFMTEIAIAAAWVGIFIAAIVVRMIVNKKDSNIIKFKRKG